MPIDSETTGSYPQTVIYTSSAAVRPTYTSLLPHELLHDLAPASFYLQLLPHAAIHSYHEYATWREISRGPTAHPTDPSLSPPSPRLSFASAQSTPQEPDSAGAASPTEPPPPPQWKSHPNSNVRRISQSPW